MNTITLPNGSWQYDPNKMLGPRGGFGAVYAGYSADLGEIAVKEIEIEAQREIRIGDDLLKRNFQNIIPIYDAGQDIDSGKNYLVMARAEKSLSDEIRAKNKIDEINTIDILLQIVNGLLEVPEIVHRDLKPGNILFQSGYWKIADFGIAKFVEESTSLHTLRDCLTPSFAAPEQWNYERPTKAVDVYALGCIAFAMLTGSAPFVGSAEDLRDQHLHDQPPISKINNPRLQNLLSMMLRKTPETRPTMERVKTLLEQIKITTGDSSPSGFGALSEVAAKISEKSGKEEAQKLSIKSEEDRRANIAHEAKAILDQVVGILFQQIQIHAPNAIIQPISKQFGKYSNYPKRIISLGDADLIFDFTRLDTIQKKDFERSGWDVITGVLVIVNQKSSTPYVWSANLWFTNLGKMKEYRWWEVGYMSNPLIRSQHKYQPFAVEDLSDADLAASPVIAHIQFGTRPKMIDDEYIDDFCNRWADLLAKAASGLLRHPSSMALN